MKQIVRLGTPLAAILIPAAFFLSVLRPESTESNALIYLAYVGFAVLLFTFVALGIGLIKEKRSDKM